MATTDERWREGPGLLASMRRYAWLVVAAVVVSGAGGYVLASLEPVTYESSARLFLTDLRTQSTLQQSRLLDPERYVPQQTERVKSRTVLARASELLEGAVASNQIRGRMRVVGEPDVNLITIHATGGTAQGAADLANAIAAAYEAVTEEQTLTAAEAAIRELETAAVRLRLEVSELQATVAADPADPLAASRLELVIAQLNDNENRQQQISIDAIVFGSGVELFEPAEPQGKPIAPQPSRMAVIAGILGFIFGGAAAYWLAGRSKKLQSREEAERILGVPMLAEIPVFDHDEGAREAEIVSDPRLDEAYGFALASIEFALRARGGSRVLITSPAPGDGKTQTALRLALAAAHGGRQILLVDADLRAHGLTRLLGAQHLPGITDVAAGDAGIDECIHTYRVHADLRLQVVGAGTRRPEAVQLLRSPTFSRAMGELGARPDGVLIDSAPILAVADTTVIAANVDGIVLVVPERTPLQVLGEVKDRLGFVTRPLLGFVYITETPGSEVYRYGYGYGATAPDAAPWWRFWDRKPSQPSSPRGPREPRPREPSESLRTPPRG